MSRRQARKQARSAAERRAQRRALLGLVALAVLVLVGIAVVVSLLGDGNGRETEAAPVDDYPYPVQMFPPDPGGRAHIPVGQVYNNYNSNPPTSGPHTSLAELGVHSEPVPKEHLVHNMEHGQVVIWYNCDGGPQPLSPEQCGELRTELAQITNDAISAGKLVVLTPYPDMDHRIALTAWQFLDAFDEFDADRVQKFIDTFYCHTDLEGFCR